MLKNIIRQKMMHRYRQLKKDMTSNAKPSYAQCGEDLILQHLFMFLGINKIRYLDIGAHHPTYLSNTYLFYKQGASGVCVEPDPILFMQFPKKRPRDTHLNCGIGSQKGDADFYLMSTPTLNTFSKKEAEHYQESGDHKVLDVIKVNVDSANEIIDKYFDMSPSLISIDVEGWDYEILKVFDFECHRPAVFCVETLQYSENGEERKVSDIFTLMQDKGYVVYADTYVNTIFVEKSVWDKRS